MFTTKSLKNAPISFAMSVHLSTCNNSRIPELSFTESYFEGVFIIFVDTFQFWLDSSNWHFIWGPTCVFAHVGDWVGNSCWEFLAIYKGQILVSALELLCCAYISWFGINSILHFHYVAYKLYGFELPATEVGAHCILLFDCYCGAYVCLQ
jgi:hypothetical protein